MVSRDDLEALLAPTTPPFSLLVVPGNHFFLRSARSLLRAEIGLALSNPAARPRGEDTGRIPLAASQAANVPVS
jgi:surfactin synthase thioesterase subunit